MIDLANSGGSRSEVSSSGAWMEGHVMATSADDFLTAIVNNADDAVIGKTCDGVIRTWNKGAERIYGYAAGEVIGSSISILDSPPPRRDVENPGANQGRRAHRLL